MTIQEFKNIIENENQIVVQDDNKDVYVIDLNNKEVLAWVSGSATEYFTIYSGLSDRKSWGAINDFSETLTNERGLSR